MLPRVCVITTGGTISMRSDPGLEGAVPAVSGSQLLDMVPGLGDFAHPEPIEYSNKPSCHLTPEMMFEIGGLARETLAREEVAGVVVTHGTDALEETAYMADLLLDTPMTLIFTAAMRNNSE